MLLFMSKDCNSTFLGEIVLINYDMNKKEVI